MNLLQGKSVVITGAGSGIGLASALLFAREGARVVCADIRGQWAEDAARAVAEGGGTAVALTCDVSNAADVDAAVQRAVDEFGRLDVMFNNAGIASNRVGQPFEEHTDADVERLFAVNGRGVFHGCRAAVVQFKKQGDGGVIVNTGSIAGIVGWGSVVYGSIKAMVIQLTRALAAEAAPHGIRVNCVCPAAVLTNFGRSDDDAFTELDPELLDMAKTLHPLGRLITAEDCASAALYLASDMSANVTGLALPVDGGYLTK
ncbi:Dihydroanticapsin 7-dehydrogenase [Mycolicibacterium vanbaalenii]|uniref:Dihydroanticapsin 7-dehydrogenase n=1 Tax=Mycolicibacterium vanbaalenii TaxID=110539 RepID=A0A5S9QWQ1_MYCVN|nr:SDR family oxidoreductase [Mycolicibacterium vanbaalenii]CAA0124513.1 Dihydroanticapsin 7-dehydrogenase [Mycolicibacterium vanbaalenii]